MLLGCNFIRSNQGGLQIEGDTFIFYESSHMTLPELGMEENDYLLTQEVVLYNIGNLLPSFRGHLTSLLERLEQQGFITKNPMIIKNPKKEWIHL